MRDERSAAFDPLQAAAHPRLDLDDQHRHDARAFAPPLRVEENTSSTGQNEPVNNGGFVRIGVSSKRGRM